MGILTGPIFKNLLRSSSTGFTELILIEEKVEGGIRSGKIQIGAYYNYAKKSFGGHNNKKSEVNVVSKDRRRNDRQPTMGAVMISNSAPAQHQQHRQDKPKRKFTKINVPLTQVL